MFFVFRTLVTMMVMMTRVAMIRLMAIVYVSFLDTRHARSRLLRALGQVNASPITALRRFRN